MCRKLVCFSVSCKCRMFLGVTQNIFRFHVSNMSYVCIVLSKKFSFYAFWLHFGLILQHGILLICIVFQSLQYMLSIHTVQQLSCLCHILVGFTFNFSFLACLRSRVDMNILVLFPPHLYHLGPGWINFISE